MLGVGDLSSALSRVAATVFQSTKREGVLIQENCVPRSQLNVVCRGIDVRRCSARLSETRNDDESSGSIWPDSEVALLCLLHQSTNRKRVPVAGRLGTAAATQPDAQARSSTIFTDAGTLAPDFLPLGIGLFIINTRDVVTCEDAQKAVETYFYSFQAIPPSNKACPLGDL